MGVRWFAMVGLLAACSLCGGGASAAPGRGALLREVLRQQSAAERSLCEALRATIASGVPARDAVRAAIELGHAPCDVIRCALESGADLGAVLAGAAEAGTPAEVLSRCAVEAGADPALVASALNATSVEPSLCYFRPDLPEGSPVVPPYGDADRSYRRVDLSPFLP